MNLINSAAKVCQRSLCFYLILTSYTVLAQQSCTTLKARTGVCVIAEECNDGKDSPVYFGDYRLRQSRLNSICNPDAKGNPTICCDSVKIKKDKFFSGKNYEEGLNPEGVKILQAKNITTACGIMKGERVAYGKDAQLGEFPWMALLIYDSRESPFNCGGSLITNQYVLTAAHCAKDSPANLIGVRLGEYDISTKLDCYHKRCSQAIDVNIAKVKVHPQYSFVERSYDIALIKLQRSVSFTKFIRPICLPVTTITSHQVVLNQQYIFAGWGFTEKSGNHNSKKLQKASLPQRDRENCIETYKRNKILDVHLCAGGEQLGASCKGDSGGPIFLPGPKLINNRQAFRYFQFGIISFGSLFCGTNKTNPIFFSNVVEMMPWITSNIS